MEKQKTEYQCKCKLPITKYAESRAGLFGMFLLMALWFDAVIAGSVLLGGGRLGPWIFPVSLVLALIGNTLLSADRRRGIAASAIGVLFMAAAIAVCQAVYDTTFDSMGYHYDISVMLTDGWNPINETPPNGSVWAAHYAKLLELTGATVLAFTGNLQTAKCVNFSLAAAALALMWSTVRMIWPKITAKWRIMLVVIAALNPVVIRQMLSFYNDFCIWFETILLICAFLRLYRDETDIFAWLVLFFSIGLGINTKFTHFFYLGVECIVFAVWLLCFKRFALFRRCLVVAVAGLAVGVAVIGFNPYVTNTSGYLSPFYPLIGGDGVDIMTANTPAMFTGGNRFEYFAKSLLSLSDTSWALLRGDVTAEGLKASYVGDMRVNGFGVLMFPCLVIGLILMIINWPSKRWWIVYGLVFAMSLLFEQSWWARYIPFLWLALIIPVIISLLGQKSRTRLNRILRTAVFLLVCANGAVSGALTLASRLAYTHYINYVFTTQKALGKPIETVNLTPTMRQQFRERGIAFTERRSIGAIADKSHLFRVFGIDYFDSWMLLPEQEYPLLYTKPRTILDGLARYPLRRYAPSGD